MKKLVPDPPPVLNIRPGLSPEAAMLNAEQHLKTALTALGELPEQSLPMNRARLANAMVNLKITKALLRVTRTRTAESVPIR